MPESQAKFRFWWFFFSLKGRVTRAPFAGFVLSTRLIMEAAAFILSSVYSRYLQSSDGEMMGFFTALHDGLGLISLTLLWPQFAVLTKRLHDLALPFWVGLLYFTPRLSQFAFVFRYAQTRLDPLPPPTSTSLFSSMWANILIPALNIAVLIGLVILAFIPGTQGRNRYGPHPHRPDQSASEVF